MPEPEPLVVACALGIERRALRRGVRGAGRGPEPDAPGPVAVVRTGMGPAAAEREISARLAGDPFTGSPVIASGFCAGLEEGMRPGDVLVAGAVRDEEGTTDCVGTATLVDSLGRLGVRVHTGVLAGSDHVVRGRERAALRADGAAGVDMESAVTLRTAVRLTGASGARPVAAVRVVVDAPEHELIRIGTVRGGLKAYRVLSSVLPAFYEWHRSLLLPRR